jgi:ABC-type nitrate/sulfonate/bicarbonate transport system substrate-binding protein
VVCVTRKTLEQRRGLVRAVVGALRRGYEFTLGHPRASIGDLVARAPGLDRSLAADQLATIRPALTLHGRFGVLDPARLRAWAAWEARFGIVRRPPDVTHAFVLG